MATEKELRARVQLATPSRVVSARELAQHRSKESCWMSIEGVVYDLTAWHEKHPGGAKLIVALSGRDATASYTKQHTSLQSVNANLERGISIVGPIHSEHSKLLTSSPPRTQGRPPTLYHLVQPRNVHTAPHRHAASCGYVTTTHGDRRWHVRRHGHS